jgi:choice-of-anchor B domain-containing protein
MRAFGALIQSLAVLAVLAAVGAPCQAQSSSFGNAVVVGEGELLVGEPNNNFRPGIVYVYHASDDGWTERQQLAAPDAERADGFGTVLALSGGTLFVAQRGGRIHTFVRDADSWRFAATLPDSGVTGLDPGCNAYGYCGTDFGLTLATDGDWLLVGEPGVSVDPGGSDTGRRDDADAPPPPAGAVHVFRRDAEGTWTRSQRLASPAPASADAFGAAIALVDGRALVGAPGAVSGVPDTLTRAGRVFEFRLEDDVWQPTGELTTAPESGAYLGAAIAAVGHTVVVGAPGTGDGSGAAHLFRRNPDAGTWSAPERLAWNDGAEGDLFGSAVALPDEEHVWVGAPVSRDVETGMAFVFDVGGGGEIEGDPRRIRFTEDETNTQDLFGHRIVARNGQAAVTATGLDHGAGGVFVYDLDDAGRWQPSGRLVSPPDALNALTGEERRCADGAVGAFDCEDVELLAFVPISMLRAEGSDRGIRMNDNWGWTDPETGREYALVGRNDGTSFVDITDPVNPVLVGDLPKTPETPRSQLWRDIKTYRNHAFIVADGAGTHGMQVFDLTRLRNVTDPPALFEPDALYRGEGNNIVESIHNIIINEETGFAYLTSRHCSGMHMVDIREPLEPRFAGCSDPGGTHDAQCVLYEGPDERHQGREICLRMSGDRFQISDVTDKQNPVELSAASHPNPVYMHQGWVTEDHRYFYMDDESDVIAGNVETTRTLIWDLSDLEDPQLAHEFMGSMPASAHNLYIKGDLAYQANYRYGLHILDVSDPLNPLEVGHFDTSPHQTGPGFSGAWSTYPFFDSGSIIVTSMQEGLFILKKRERPVS